MPLTKNVYFLLDSLTNGGRALNSSIEADPDLTATNTLTMQPGEYYESSTSGSAFIEYDFGSDTAVDSVALLWTNAESTGTWRIRIASSQENLTSSPTYDSRTYNPSDIDAWPGTLDLTGWLRRHGFYYLRDDAGGPVTQRYLRIDIDGDPATGGNIVGRVMAGVGFQPEVNVTWGSGMPQHREIAERFRTHGGNKEPVENPRELGVRATMQFTSESDLQWWLDLARTHGTSRDLLYIQDPTSDSVHQGILHGLFAEIAETSIPELSLYQSPFGLEELV